MLSSFALPHNTEQSFSLLKMNMSE